MATRASSPPRSRSTPGPSGSGARPRSSGSKSSSASRSSTAVQPRPASRSGRSRPQTPAGRPGPRPRAKAVRRRPSAVQQVGRGLRALWLGLAHALGAGARRIGTGARDMDPALRRDGVGLLLVGGAIVVAAEFWWGLPQPVGRVVRVGVSGVIGTLAYAAPILLALMAWRTLRHPDRNGPGGRQAVGWSALLLGLLGLVNIAHGLPRTNAPAQLREAGGIVGYISSSLLSDLLSVYVAVPLLILLTLFGILVVVGIPLHELPERVRAVRAALQRPVVSGEADAVPGGLEFGLDRAYDSPVIAEPKGRKRRPALGAPSQAEAEDAPVEPDEDSAVQPDQPVRRSVTAGLPPGVTVHGADDGGSEL